MPKTPSVALKAALAALVLAAISGMCLPYALAEDIALPAPQTEGGIGLFEALKNRASAPGGDFSPAELSMEELSAVLWAATGLNRGEQGWTVPMAEGLPPYVDVYALGASGVYRYDWKGNRLVEISRDNVKDKVGHQGFVRRASWILAFASNPEGLSALRNPESGPEFAQVLTGAMTQNVYLAAAALKLGTRYIHSFYADELKSALKLTEGSVPIALMLLGK
ncbi:MAG: SagB/ThcOx family dehydrogenase [Deltaproteobacteria bacterium]|jgi:nitroreductase|nr:SagB/ThcOx family dehydrogenase [Deltaproteobacteria bacterium]